MSSSNRLSPSFSGRYPKKLRGRAAKATAEAAVNSVRRNTAETFHCTPVIVAGGAKSGAASGTAGDVNLISTGSTLFEQNVLGTHTDILMSHSSSGLDINSVGEAADDGSEITQGITARSKSAFTVGTDGPFFLEVEFSIGDVSGTDDCAVGFRKAEAYQAALDSYDEMACLNVISGDIKIETILNNGTTATTDTTQDWADAATHTLRVEVALDGSCRFMVDDADVTVAAPFTFDAGEVVVPFMFFLNHTDVADAVNLKQWNCGLV
jgi:hypothetical protein